ncbi:MAG: methylated-DNA--[protein]-cysteine S-methyltransferase, partial [Bdellovibrionales bacterium]|nr:methylated-DNA--[protein]-cysteine S-methyltransferase [Bdellovibrionales bacterium]
SMNHRHIITPVGTLLMTWNSHAKLARVDWLPICGEISEDRCSTAEMWAGFSDAPLGVLKSIGQYFKTGEPLEDSLNLAQRLDEVLDSSSWSAFERKVYLAVLKIPHGETRTYSWVAARAGNPSAGRAVGQALRRNRHLILIPCHRVVSSHDLGGFMGSDNPEAEELQFKKRLLAWEHSWRNPLFSFLSA